MIQIKTIRYFLLFFIVLLYKGCSSIDSSKEHITAESLNESIEQSFLDPPDSVRPWVYWYWISDNISKEGITRDLEAMARVGIGKALIGNIGLDNIEYGDVPVLSEEWWELTEHAIREGSRTGVNIGLFNSPGWSQSGGPWVRPEEAMRYLVNSELKVEGPVEINTKLPVPADTFQRVSVVAIPLPANEDLKIHKFSPAISTTPALENSQYLSDGNKEKEFLFSRDELINNTLIIDLKVEDEFTARSLVLHPAETPFAADVTLQVKNGDVYEEVKKIKLNRSNKMPTVGPMVYGPVATAFPAIKGNQFRLIFSGVNTDGGIKEIEINNSPVLNKYVEKQLGKMHQTPLPMWGEYQWATQPEPDDQTMVIDQEEIINLNDKVSADGTLKWEVPEGRWLVINTGMALTGVTNGPAAPHGTGLEIDKNSKEAVRSHFNSFIGKVLERMPEPERQSFTHVVADSYETGSQNWTDGFAEDFEQQYGYDPLPWLPVLTGRIIGSADQSDRFLWDMRRLVADKVAYDYVGGLREISEKNGLRIWLENYGHWGYPAEFLQYGGQSHDIGGEFWAEGDLGSIECRAASSAGHIYGKKVISAEAFTAGGKDFRRNPASIKRRGDWAFTEGINHFVLHVYIQQPWEDRVPGMNAPFGTEFNRHNTWFEQSGTWIDYLRRSMFMLQRGLPVSDVAYFIGEDAPKMTGIQYPELPEGYSFDYINGEVLLNRADVKDGKIILPDGMSYRLLVLPPLKTMRPELLKKIQELVSKGATILGPAPERSPSLEGYPSSDREVKRMAAELWGGADGSNVKFHDFGKGRVFTDMDLGEVFSEMDMIPDLKITDGSPLLFTHRTMSNAEIYFLTNQSDDVVNVAPEFRVSGKKPELWNPVTGEIRLLSEYIEKGRAIKVPLTFEANQSWFVVFRDSKGTVQGENFPEQETIEQVAGPWQVTFEPSKTGPDEPVIFTSLIDWKDHEKEAIRYYSGTANYSTTFDIDEIEENRQYFIDLGKVEVMAEVRLNGKKVGGVWTPPYQLNVTGVLQEGQNNLEVSVVNSWVNRLVGDAKLPEEERSTWLMINNFNEETSLEPSGLLGPIIINASIEN